MWGNVDKYVVDFTLSKLGLDLDHIVTTTDSGIGK